MSEAYVPSVYIPPSDTAVPRIDLKTVKVGDEIPKLTRYGDLQIWNRYAGVNYEFAGHHMDDAVGKHEGFDGAFGMAPFVHALVHVLLRQWVGDDTGRVVKAGIQLRRPWIRGRTMIQGGKVTAIREEGDEHIISLEIWGDNDEGERLIHGDAEVAVLT